MKKPKILFWDIETSDLKADFGHVLCIGYKWYGQKKSHLISLSDNHEWPQPGKILWDDKFLVKRFLLVLQEANQQVTWYGKRFDEPYIRSRMVHWGLRNDFPPVHHVDLWETCRKEFCLSNNRLVTAGKFLGLEEGKISMPVVDWKHAAQGDKAAMRRTMKRCASDVQMLEEAYEKMLPYIRTNRANFNAIMNVEGRCPACGSTHIHRKGTRATLTNQYHRWQCQDCGTWSSSPKGRREDVLR